MSAEMTAIIENGNLKFDSVLPFPDRTRVKVTIEAVDTENQSLAAWKRLLEQVDRNPLPGLATEFSRDELYERD